MNKIVNLRNKNVLLLQGPVGLFFKKLDNYFRLNEINTFRIGFNAGDEFFANTDNFTAYRDTPEKWNIFIENYLKKYKIHSIFLLGDCRFYQSVAIQIAKKSNIDIFVFEEGYIRPYYITMERFGVNDFSQISRDPNFYKKLTSQNLKSPPKNATPNPIYIWSIVIMYYFIAKLFHFRYPHYLHHRNYSAVEEFFFGCRSLVRKILYRGAAKKCLSKIENDLSKKYYFVPLQTHNDFQILQHSNYGSIEKFIIEVLESFAHYAPKDSYLMFKHHPIDRGRKHYKSFILQQAKELNIDKRILITHDTHLPECLKNAIGTVTINSTVGLSSIYHSIPTITLGNAIYDIEGLTCKGMNINQFWTSFVYPDSSLYEKYRNFLIENTQVNANFYDKFHLIQNIKIN